MKAQDRSIAVILAVGGYYILVTMLGAYIPDGAGFMDAVAQGQTAVMGFLVGAYVARQQPAPGGGS